MGKVTIRSSQTSQGSLSFNPWNGDDNPYAFSAINLGSNPIANVEIASSLNLFNIAHIMYDYYYIFRLPKFNPKLYLSTVQSVATAWNGDTNPGLSSAQKSGSGNKY